MFRLSMSVARSRSSSSLKTAAVWLSLCAVAPSFATDVEMTEFYSTPLNYYFITATATDKVALDGMPGWARTGKSFMVGDAEMAGAVPLTRFYFDGVAHNKERGSHFYTVVESERAALRAMNPSNAAAAGLPVDEGSSGYVYAPVVVGLGFGTYCASPLTPVYRAFRGGARFPDDPNHHFSTNLAAHSALIAAGWDDDGLVFCVSAN